MLYGLLTMTIDHLPFALCHFTFAIPSRDKPWNKRSILP
jgi:hypothetical protein